MISAKRSFSNASNKYNKTLNEKTMLIQKLMQNDEKIQKEQNVYISEGLLYFSKDKRTDLLNQAKDLCYSKDIIKKLSNIKDENWNTDTVDENLIRDFESIEKFVNKHTPLWQKSFIYKLGGTIQSEEEKGGYTNE